MKKQNPVLIQWEKATMDLAMLFTTKYFGKVSVEQWWVGEHVGGVLYINDWFFDFEDIVEFMRHNYSKKMLFQYMEDREKADEKGGKIFNIKDYKKLN
jgi:hypothetical protein